MPSYTVVGLGELLWDLLPGGRQIGGAPANFVYIATVLGDRGVVASCIGADALGDEIRAKLISLGLDASFLQVDPSRPTGSVNVQVDPKGQPTFEIIEHVAWDYITWTPKWESLARQAAAIYFGTLGQRYSQSLATTMAFVAAAPRRTVKIFDANLRQHFFSPEVIAESIKLANIVKLNDEELPRVMQLLDLAYDEEKSAAERMRRAYDLRLVCVTRGEKGSLLVAEGASDEHPGFRVTVADTVGAGDAFTATLVHHFLRGAALPTINEAANRMGAWVASHPGGTPQVDAALLDWVRAPQIV
jgi:fructokinase